MTDSPSSPKISISAHTIATPMSVVGTDGTEFGLISQDGRVKLGVPTTEFTWLEPNAFVIAFIGITYARIGSPGAKLLVPARDTIIKPN